MFRDKREYLFQIENGNSFRNIICSGIDCLKILSIEMELEQNLIVSTYKDQFVLAIFHINLTHLQVHNSSIHWILMPSLVWFGLFTLNLTILEEIQRLIGNVICHYLVSWLQSYSHCHYVASHCIGCKYSQGNLSGELPLLYLKFMVNANLAVRSNVFLQLKWLDATVSFSLVELSSCLVISNQLWASEF